jgi:hypothetical protein
MVYTYVSEENAAFIFGTGSDYDYKQIARSEFSL